jgi:hypothetical protein
LTNTAPAEGAVPSARRSRPTGIAAVRIAMTPICTHTRPSCDEASRVFGVTTNASGRRNHTLPTVVVTAFIHNANSARLYCWPRQVGRPQPTSRNRSWFVTSHGSRYEKNSSDHAWTGESPNTRNNTGATR